MVGVVLSDGVDWCDVWLKLFELETAAEDLILVEIQQPARLTPLLLYDGGLIGHGMLSKPGARKQVIFVLLPPFLLNKWHVLAKTPCNFPILLVISTKSMVIY